MLKILSLYFLFSLSGSTSLIAADSALIDNVETDILVDYEYLLLDKVNHDLFSNHEQYVEHPNKFWHFLNEVLFGIWDFDATTAALIGNEILNSLSDIEFAELSRVFKVTLMRYAFESLSFYHDQKLNIVNIKINEQKTFAWLKINIDSSRFPKIHLDLLLKRTFDNAWKAVDFRLKGITYVNLKKHIYRHHFQELKLKGLLSKLEEKNKLYFKDLCKSEANYIDPNRPPCLWNYDKK